MASADSPDSEPPTIDPYDVLQVPTDASIDNIKRAYRKRALRLHPDKAPAAERASAHQAFQELAFAYAVLSEPRRRARYDATGSTAETLDIDGGEFDWRDFFRAQFSEVVTEQKIAELKDEYQGSAEERADVLRAYGDFDGDMRKVFEVVMLSSMLGDEERFRGYINAAIEKGEVEAYDKYVNESKKSREKRIKGARKEAAEAEQLKKELDAKKDGKKGSGKGKRGGGGLADLAAMIQQRNAARSNTFLDDLEAKYGGGKATNGTKKKRKMDEPPEEAFAEVGRRKRKGFDEEELQAVPKKAAVKRKPSKKAKTS